MMDQPLQNNFFTHQRKRMLIWLCISVFFCLSAFKTHAQGYTFSASSGTFTSIVGSDEVDVDAIEYDDRYSDFLPIGFPFTYYGSSYSHLRASSNGILKFSAGEMGNSNNFYTPHDRFIAPLWEDLSGSGGTASYAVSGTAPNRVFTFEWLNWKWDYVADDAGISFQVKLYETSNKIEFIYRQEPGALEASSSAFGASIGLKGNTSTQFYSLSNSSASPSISSFFSENDIVEKPATGQIYSFSPPTAPPAPTVQASALSATIAHGSLDVSWTNGNGSKRVVFVKQTSSTTETLSLDNNTSWKGSWFGDDSAMKDGWYCVFNGTSNAVTIDYLTPGLPHRVQVFEYNGADGYEQYLTSSAINNPVSATIPVVRPTELSAIKILRVSDSEITIKGLPIGDGDRKVIFIKDGNTGVAPVADNVTYTASSIYGAGSQVGSTGWYCVYNDSWIDDLTIKGLSPNSEYRLHIVELNGPEGIERYYGDEGPNNVVQATTLSPITLPGYTFTSSAGTFEPIVGGTAVHEIETISAISSSIDLPFTFVFGGVPYTKLKASSDGLLTLNNYVESNPWNNDLMEGHERAIIAPLWSNCDGSFGNASYQVSGSAPNRVFTFEWLNWAWESSASAPQISFQVKLHETTNAVEFVYQNEPEPIGASWGVWSSVGLAFANTGAGNFISLNNLSADPTVSSVIEPHVFLEKPLNGQTYLFTPFTRAAQTITFNAIAPKTVGDVFTISATSTSGLPVQLTSSSPWSVELTTDPETMLTTVTINARDNALITATQEGDSEFAPATPVSVQVEISKGVQTITFDELAPVTYGDSPFSLEATSSSGYAVNFSSDENAVATVSGNIVLVKDAGTATITASTPENWDFIAAEDVERTLTVNKAVIDATADDQNRLYGDANPSLTASYAGFKNGDGLSDLNSLPVLSTSVTTTSNAGTYPITLTGGEDNNYSFANFPGTFTVEKAPLTATAVNLVRVYGEDQPLTVTYSGFKNGETKNVLDVLPVASTAATATTSPGTYSITVASGSDGNYDFNYVPGVLTITKAPQSISFAMINDKNVDDPTFALEATATSQLPVEYSVSGPAVLEDGNKINITGTGLITIKATQSGNLNYDAAPEITRTFNATTKLNQTITFDALPTRRFDQGNFNLTAGATSGLSVTFSSSNNDIAEVVANELVIKKIGTVTITASQPGNDTYNSALSIERTLTITKGNQSMTFAPLPVKVMTEGTFTLNATVSTGLPIVYFSSNTAVATITGNVVTLVSKGSTVITARQDGNENYLAVQLSQELRVMDVQTITFGTLEPVNYGDESFELDASASSGLTVVYESSNPEVATVSGNTVTILKRGTTVITASQSGDENFVAANDVTQTLTVRGALPEVSTNVLTFEEVAIDKTEQKTLTITNNGDADLIISNIVYPTAFTGNHSSATITPGNSLSIVVTFAPTAIQTYEGEIEVMVNTPAGKLFIQVSGEGELVTSVEKPSELKVNIYPNPVTEFVLIESSILENGVTPTFLDASGKNVSVALVKVDAHSFKADLSHLRGGIYFLQMEYKNGMITKVIVKK